MSAPGVRAVVLATTAAIRGGVWRNLEDLALELRERGVPVSVALRSGAADLHAAAHRHELPVLRFDAGLRRRDCVWHGHLHDTYDRRLWLATLARRAIGPVVLTEHLPHTNASDPHLQPGPRSPLAGPAKTVFKRVQLGAADAVIVPSPSSARFLAERYGPAGRVAVVAHGLRAAPARERPPRRPGPMRVLASGSVIVQKGHDVLLEASARAGGSWTAEVIGTGSERQRLAELARARGLPVRFSGWCEDVAAALADADVACLPSRWESAGYAALEAMRAGLPVVASDVDGLRELVEHGRSGLLVPPEDPVALAGALSRLAADPDLCARLAAGARRRAERFTSADMAAATLTVYADAVAERARRARPATSPNTIPM